MTTKEGKKYGKKHKGFNVQISAGETLKENIYQGPAREKQVGENNHPSMQLILHLPVCKHGYLKMYVRVWAISLSTHFKSENTIFSHQQWSSLNMFFQVQENMSLVESDQ